MFAHDVGRPRVIDELLLTVWLKSDRSGLQLAARVVLPRTADPRTGRSLSTVVFGSSYNQVGHWQQLRLGDLPQSVARHVRALRTQIGPHVDDREAYVETVLLNLYGGPGPTTVWIDDLDVAGHVGLPPTPPSVATGPSPMPSSGQAVSPPRERIQPTAPSGSISTRPDHGWVTADTLPRYGRSQHQDRPVRTPDLGLDGPESRTVRLAGSTLSVEGQPMFPRIIRHQGEPLELLKRLRFNSVWLSDAPTPALMEEASRLGMWLIVKPPVPVPHEAQQTSEGTIEPIGPQYARVLAWDMGQGLSRRQLSSTQQRAAEVRQADHQGRRPLVCQPVDDLRGYSRQVVDLILLDRQPLGTSLELAEYGTWLRQQPRLALPGTPFWCTVQTQPAPAMIEQLTVLEPGRTPPRTVDPEQIRLLVYTAVAAGSRGLLFLSDSPLHAQDPDTRRRALALELLNLELEIIEPWLASGTVWATAPSGNREVTATVLRIDRGRLLLPIRAAPGAQCVPSPTATDTVPLVVPGVPESSGVYELLPGGLRPLRHRNGTGGIHLTLEDFGLTGLVLLAHDALVIDSLSRRVTQAGRRWAELRRDLALAKLEATRQAAGELARVAPAPPMAGQGFREVQLALQKCHANLGAGQLQSAGLEAGLALLRLQSLQRTYWDAALGAGLSPVVSPAAVSFDTLPWHWRLGERIATSRCGSNRLPAGDFEDPGAMRAAGWRHFQYGTGGLLITADVAPGAARGGKAGLRLAIRPADPDQPPGIVESPPLWIVSPPVSVEAGQLIRIRGWVQVPAPIAASVDGLLIADSLTGDALAERISKTAGWKQFTLHRVAPQSGPMTVSFVLSGLGEVLLDEATVEVLER